MQLSTILATLATAAVVIAQNQTVTIMVGGETNTPGGIFQFIPNSLNATAGSVITFEWTGAPGNHSVTQSSFDAPCTPLQGGFDSGWILLSGTSAPSPPPSWALTITNDTAPIWFFCKQLLPSPHCTSGMVGGINIQPGPNSLAAFQMAAASAGMPGQGEGGLVGVGASASAGPFVPSGAQLFPTTAATATAPPSGATVASSGGSAAGSASNTASAATTSSSGSSTSGAIPAASFERFTLFATALAGLAAGIAMVL